MNPEYKNLTKIPYFRRVVLQNFPFIEEDFDALTDYGLLCKVVEYLNKVIEQQNLVNDNTDELYQAYITLKNYVDNYFNNLDVQEEINKKLESMAEDGSLYNIIRSYTDPIVSEQNSRITQVENELQAVASGSPLVASSVSEMTDTSRVYVNTTDGKWYYYDGDSWEIGGTYQSSGISDNSITIFKLDDLLQENFIKEYTNIQYNTRFQGYAKVVNNSLVIESDSNYSYDIVDLNINKTYCFQGFNFYEVVGLVVVDSNDNIIYSTRNQSSASTSFTPVNLTFKTNVNGLKAYISKANESNSNWSVFQKNNVYFLEFNSITPNYRENTIEYIENKENIICTYLTNINSYPNTQESNNTGYLIYKMSKGCKYKILSANVWAIAGIIIVDNQYKTIYSSSNSYKNNKQDIEYTFTASQDGYIYLSYRTTDILPQIYIINALNEINNRYNDKIWCAMGDSLTDPSTLGANVKNYVNYVSEKLNITSINYGHGGSGYKALNGNNYAFYQIANTLNSNVNVITIFGSFNDTFVINNWPFGTINDNTTETIFGSVNVTLDRLIANYPNAVIGVIIPTPWNTRNNVDTTAENMEKANTYVNGLKQICEKRSIPYLDLYTQSNLYPWNSTYNSLFFLNGDGTHPNTNGHKKIAGQIVEFIKKLLY